MTNKLQDVPTSTRGTETKQALNSTKRASKPALLLMAGFAGSGKTTLATALNDMLLQENEQGWQILSKDKLKHQRLANGEEEESAGRNAFEDLFGMIRQDVLEERESVIIDTSNEKPFIHENIADVVKQMERDHRSANFHVILCVANKERRTRRLNNRGSVFAPFVKELPTILDDSELLDRFYRLFSNDPVLQDRFRLLLENPEELEHFNYLVGDKNLIVNTNQPQDFYIQDVWREINILLKGNEYPSL